MAIFWFQNKAAEQKNQTPAPDTTGNTAPKTPGANDDPMRNNTLAEPTADFLKRVTKKPFGIYVTPKDSPVQPERFTGYHTGADAEYGDITDDVPVRAIAPGKVVVSKIAQGYGGVMVIRHSIDDLDVLVLYGHLRPSSMLLVDSDVNSGTQIAILGRAFSTETDGERRHLHLGILNDDKVDLRGYVQDKSQLDDWYDPIKSFANPSM